MLEGTKKKAQSQNFMSLGPQMLDISVNNQHMGGGDPLKNQNFERGDPLKNQNFEKRFFAC